MSGAKILVVSSLMPGATAFYLIRELRGLGHTLAVISDINDACVTSLRFGVCDVPAWIEASGFKPDLLLFIEGGTRRLFPSGMENLACLSAWYAIDTHIHPELHARTARLFDVSFVAQREFLPLFAGSNAHWLPLAADPGIYPATLPEPEWEVAYVGSENRTLHPERSILLDAIRAKYSKVYLGRAEPARIGEIYARAKIVFNKSARNDVNMRYFEGMASGAALVTDRLAGNGVEELFSPGEDFVEYHDKATLIAAIDRLLANDDERRRIGSRGRETVLKRHTYAQRAQQVLDTLSGLAHQVRPGPEDYLPVYHLLRYPDGVLDQAVKSLFWMRANGDRNPVLAIVYPALRVLTAILLWAYRLRYRIRYRSVVGAVARPGK
ncbi:MAG: glycosyltransferase [Burkholderiales bacterium]